MNSEKGLVLAYSEVSGISLSLDESPFYRLFVIPICTALVGVGDVFVK